MKNISEMMNKYFIYAIYAFLSVSLIVNFRSCGVAKDNRKLRTEVEALKQTQDSLINQTYTKQELNKRMEILGYEISKRMLYDQNSVVRTKLRPDDRMNEYDRKIDELQKYLND